MNPTTPTLKPSGTHHTVRHGSRARSDYTGTHPPEGRDVPGNATRSRRAPTRKRRRVEVPNLVEVRIDVKTDEAAPLRKGRPLLVLCAIPVLVISALVLRWNEPPLPPEPEQVFLFEELPPEPEPQARPDPSPPAPPVEKTEAPPPPPPQFGLQEEQLSEVGGLAVATGNTLMTEADSVVREPVAALPPQPEIMDQAPRILKGRAPEYPIRALERGLEATVVVLISIDTLGRVSQVDVEQSGGGLFDGEVVRAVKRLVFQPPVRGGQRMTARFRQPYEFRLQ